MEEIARMAGVSIGTVSRVVNNKDKVHPETRARLQALIDRVGYRPSASAQALASRRTNNVMLVVPNITDDYYPKVVQHMSRLCRARGRRLLLGVSDFDPEIEAEFLAHAHERVVDGLLVAPLQDERNTRYFMELARREIPVVLMDLECRDFRMPTVKYDDLAGAREAVDHLLDKGHRRIGFCASTMKFQTVQDRFQGYREALAARGIGIDEALCLNHSTGLESWPWSSLAGLLDSADPPSALFAENDAMAHACIRFLKRRGLRVPEEMAVVGFGDTYLPHEVGQSLTSVALPMEDSCAAALEMLLSLIAVAPEDRPPPEIKTLSLRLVQGETT